MFSDMYRLCIDECTAHHKRSKTFSGSLVLPHLHDIKSLVSEYGVRRILDYGCGKGVQYGGENCAEKYWGVPVTKYDPCVDIYSKRPDRHDFDLVICSHVMVWLPTADVETVKRDMSSYTGHAGVVYVVNRLGPVKKNILSNPSKCPRDWSADDWHAAFTGTYGSETYILSIEHPLKDGTGVVRLPTWRSK